MRFITPKSTSPDLSPELQTHVSKCLSGTSPECAMNTSESPCPKLSSLFPQQTHLPARRAAPSAQCAASETMTRPIPLARPTATKSSRPAPNPFLYSCSAPCQVQGPHGALFYFMDEIASQQIILLPLILPSNPHFINTRVSFPKHTSLPVSFLLKVLKASHTTAHKRISKWLTKHANLVWSYHISQDSPQSILLVTT